jgi:hypothetical protein
MLLCILFTPYFQPLFIHLQRYLSHNKLSFTPTMAKRSSTLAFGGGITLSARANRKRQTPAPKKAAPKKTGRASRVIEESDEDEVEEVK